MCGNDLAHCGRLQKHARTYPGISTGVQVARIGAEWGRMKAKTAGLLRFIGPPLVIISIYIGYTVVTSLIAGSIHWGSVMGLKPLVTREQQPEQFQILMAFLGFDAVAALVAGLAMSYFAFFRKPDDA